MNMGIIAANRRRSGVSAPTGTATMTQFASYDAKRIFQRTTSSGGGYGKGQGTIPLTISSATAGTLNARLSSGGGTRGDVQAEWAAATITNGATTANITGVDAGLYWAYLDIKDSTGSWQNGTVLVNVGELFAVAGQSLMSRMIGKATSGGSSTDLATAGVTPSTYASVLACYNDTATYEPTVATMPWQAPQDGANGSVPNSVGCATFLNDAISMLGVNCGVIGYARGGTYLSFYISGQDGWTRFSAVVARAGGAFKGFYWGQGHSDSSVCCSATAYQAMLDIIYAQVDGINSLASFNTYVWTIPAIGSNTLGTDWQYNNVRKGAKDWCTANSATYVHMYDFEMDLVHQANTLAGAGWMGREMARAMRSSYGLSSGLGPVPLSATRSGTNVDVTFSDVGQTNLVLTGTTKDLFKLFRPGETNNKDAGVDDNRYRVSTVTVLSATQLRLGLLDNPGVGQALDLWVNRGIWAVDPSANHICDNRTDDGLPRGRCVGANFSAIVVAAPSPGGATAAPPVVAANVSTLTFTPTSAGYGTAATGFGQRLNAGRGTSSVSASFMPAYTLEGFFICPSTTSTRVLFRGLPDGEWVGVLSGGNLSVSGALTGATTLIAGKLYYFAVVKGPTGQRIYLQNITDATAGIRDANSGSAFTGWPNGAPAFELGHLSGGFIATGATPVAGQLDEFLYSYGEKYTGTTITAPTAPFTGAETNAVGLWHLDGNMTEVIQR